jgi:hypothetical protein
MVEKQKADALKLAQEKAIVQKQKEAEALKLAQEKAMVEKQKADALKLATYKAKYPEIKDNIEALNWMANLSTITPQQAHRLTDLL